MNDNQRHAVVRRQADRLETIQRYLPRGYQAEALGGDVWIHGEDNAGWTLDGYVIPRLASGLYFAEELSACARCGKPIFFDRGDEAWRAPDDRDPVCVYGEAEDASDWLAHTPEPMEVEGTPEHAAAYGEPETD